MITSLVQGDTPSWLQGPYTDPDGIVYDSSAYGLTTTIVGPSAPVVLTGVPTQGVVTEGYWSEPGPGWETTISQAQSSALLVGLYFYTATLTASGFSLTIDNGELTVLQNLANAPAGYDGRTQAEKIVAQYEQAFTQWQATGGRVQAYTIGNREMRFQAEKDILDGLRYWRARVFTEKSLNKNSVDRNILVRFQRAR
jgi:hypothetical protein